MFRTLRAGPYTRSLAYDPESDFLASMSAEGTLQIWDMADGKAKHTQKKAAPKVVIALTLATADTCPVAVSCTNYTLPISALHATLIYVSAVHCVLQMSLPRSPCGHECLILQVACQAAALPN